MRKAKNLQCQSVQFKSITANQPVLGQAEEDHIRNTGLIECYLTYVMLHVIKKVFSSLVPDVVHERGFIRSQGMAIFRICQAGVDLICRSKGQICGH